MKGRYEIRFYNERYNMDFDYYTGNDDIKKSVWCDTPTKLKDTLWELLKTEEGETYSVWDHTTEDIIIGGAFDPNDIDSVEYYFSTDEEDDDDDEDDYWDSF